MAIQTSKLGVQPKAIELNRLAGDLSLFIVIVGVRGSGKTLLMTHFICEALREAYAINTLRHIKGDKFLPRRKVNVWSNYKVERVERLPITGKRILLKSQDLDIEKLIIWDNEFSNGVINFDEIDQVADRQDWMNTVSKMLNSGVQVMRHRNLSFITSIQSLNWLNSRLQWQSDIIIKCRDLAFTPWGRGQHLQPGEVAELMWIDKSGIITGRSYEEYPMVYKQLFFGKRYWFNYQTHHEFNIADMKTKYRVKYAAKEIDFSGQQEEREGLKDMLAMVKDYFAYNNPGEPINSVVFWQTAEQLGFPKRPHTADGKLLSELGVKYTTTSGYKYFVFDEAS